MKEVSALGIKFPSVVFRCVFPRSRMSQNQRLADSDGGIVAKGGGQLSPLNYGLSENCWKKCKIWD